MQSQSRNLIAFFLFTFAFLAIWQYGVVPRVWPVKPKPPTLSRADEHAAREWLARLASTPGSAAGLAATEFVLRTPASRLREPPPAPQEAPLPSPKETVGPPPALVDLGGDDFNLRVKLNPQGAAVERVVLTKFKEATPEGRPTQPPENLYLIDGRDGPSYVMLHYDRPADDHPRSTLGLQVWQQEAVDPGDPDRKQVRFATTLPRQGVHITKTFSLRRGDYHVGLTVQVERLKDAKDATPFRYQITGATGLPIEGVWYTSTHRNALIGWAEPRGGFRRQFEDSGTLWTLGAGSRVSRGESSITYAGVAVQYFASMLVVDDQQPQRNFLEWARATTEGLPPEAGRPSYLGDITVRAVTEPLNLAPDAPVTHQYLLYNGPLKVRLLRQLGGDAAVDPALVDRYEHTLHLNTLADYQSPGFFGSVAGAILWTDLVILTTNAMHSLLGLLHTLIPNYALCIIGLTVLVRGTLFPLSRRQAASSYKMQEKMAKLAPEIKKLQEKYKDDFQAFNQARNELFLRNGVNPLAAMGGCFILLLQMPILMGLYFAMQESIFFRLQPLWSAISWWVPNLAAPDMLVSWTDRIPFISTPESLGGMLYLGPYFNILPVIAVGLMLVQQKMMTPPPTDEQQATQQKMMKFMTVIMGVFFYKMPAGLCIYFVSSSLWSLVERKLVARHKPVPTPGADVEAVPLASGPTSLAAAMTTRPQSARPERAADKGRRDGRRGDRKPIGRPDRPPPGSAGASKKTPTPPPSEGTMAKLRAWWQKVLDEAKKK